MVAVDLLAEADISIAFSPTGHGLMTLIISFLVVSKVNMSYDRYMGARDAIGNAVTSLREMTQTVLVYTQYRNSKLAKEWAREVRLVTEWSTSSVRMAFALSHSIVSLPPFNRLLKRQ